MQVIIAIWVRFVNWFFNALPWLSEYYCLLRSDSWQALLLAHREAADGLVWHRRTIFLQIICHAVVCIGRVTHLNTDEKTVQLGLREHLGSGRANGVLSGNDHEGIQHLASDAVYGYRALFHDFQKGGLGYHYYFIYLLLFKVLCFGAPRRILCF